VLIKLVLLFLGVILLIGWVGTVLRRRREAFCPRCGRPRTNARCACGRA
jgi:hypothetical protein